AAGFEAYIIGGAVRDMLLGKTPKDFDLTTNAKPDEILAIKGFLKSFYKDTAQAYGVTRVYLQIPDEDSAQTHEVELEIATYRKDIGARKGRKDTKVKFSSLREDIKRRDFTINALAFDPITQEIVDEVNGMSDLKKHLIRFVGRPSKRIKEDPLRVLRAIRLKHQLAFSFEKETSIAIKQAVARGRLGDIAAERIKTELSRVLMHPRRKIAFEDLDYLGVLNRLLPEVAATKGVAQPKELHAEGDVFTHTMLSVGYLPEIVSPRLAWATLLHDIGKAPSYESAKDTGDRIRFSDHYSLGADMAKTILKRLRFSQRFREEVAWMIHNHLSIDTLPKMRPRRADNFMSHPAFGDLIELHKADAHAAWSIRSDGSIDDGPANFKDIEDMWVKFQAQKASRPPSLKGDLGVDGKWLMDKLEIKKGPRLGKLLKELENSYLNHEIHSKEEALRQAKRLLKRA
ncbi:MAG: CCA tRNA nucleotidyltransferase, partial [Candidatus Saccharimonadales bacterium]